MDVYPALQSGRGALLEELLPIEKSSHPLAASGRRISEGSDEKGGLICSSTIKGASNDALLARTMRLLVSHALMPHPRTISFANICQRVPSYSIAAPQLELVAFAALCRPAPRVAGRSASLPQVEPRQAARQWQREDAESQMPFKWQSRSELQVTVEVVRAMRSMVTATR